MLDLLKEIGLAVAESAVETWNSDCKKYSRDKRFSEEQRELYRELGSRLDKGQDWLSNARAGKDEEVGYNYNEYDEHEKFGYEDKAEIFYDAKALKQKNSVTLCDMLYEEEFIDWDSKWKSLGKLKDFYCRSDVEKKVGLLRLVVDDKIVYITRAITQKNGGIAKKLVELQNFEVNKKSKMYTELVRNIENVYVDVIYVGNDIKAVDISKKLEKELVLKYKPNWM